MNHSSRFRTTRRLVLLAALTGFALVARAADADASVQTPAKRQEVVDQAAKFLAVREMPAVTNDPFHPKGFDELIAGLGRPAGAPATPTTPGDTPVAQPTGPRNDRDLLQAIGAVLKPKGLVNFGGKLSLSFGQKRVKAGDTLTITFEGTQYTLTVTAITPPNFTLRLNREEFTRTIN